VLPVSKLLENIRLFAKAPYKRDVHVAKETTILGSLLIIATPYFKIYAAAHHHTLRTTLQ